MTKRRAVLAAVFALTVLGGGVAASGVARAYQPAPSKASTTTLPVYTVAPCVDGVGTYGGGGCPTTKATTTTSTTVKPRTKNAALPKNGVVTTTTAAVKPPANAATWKTVNGVAIAMTCKAGYTLKAGACVPAPTTTTTIARVKNGTPKPSVTPGTTCAAGGTCSNTRK